jgi:hypothetical protein
MRIATRLALRVSCVTGFLATVPFASGCLSATNASPPSNGGPGSPDATAVLAGDGGGAGANVPLQGAAFGPVIDDMSADQSATGGSWYSYSSRTVPNSEPPIPTTDAGTLNPLEGTSFPPETSTGHVPPLILDGALDGLDGGPLAFREFSGDAIPKWGAGFGLDLISGLPDGGPVAINACPAGMIFDTEPDASGVGIPQPFDASAYTGFAFWGISLESGSLTVEVHLDDSDTTPWGGTFCDACKSSGQCTGSREAGTLDCPCSDNFYEQVTFEPGHWTQFAVRWSDAKFQANHWSDEGPLVFDTKHVYNIHFQDTITSTATPPFDIAVADLQWLTN